MFGRCRYGLIDTLNSLEDKIKNRERKRSSSSLKNSPIYVSRIPLSRESTLLIPMFSTSSLSLAFWLGVWYGKGLYIIFLDMYVLTNTSFKILQQLLKIESNGKFGPFDLIQKSFLDNDTRVMWCWFQILNNRSLKLGPEERCLTLAHQRLHCHCVLRQCLCLYFECTVGLHYVFEKLHFQSLDHLF